MLLGVIAFCVTWICESIMWPLRSLSPISSGEVEQGLSHMKQGWQVAALSTRPLLLPVDLFEISLEQLKLNFGLAALKPASY